MTNDVDDNDELVIITHMNEKLAMMRPRPLRSRSMGRPKKTPPGTEMTLSFKVESELIAAIDAEAVRMLPGGKVSRTQAIKVLLSEALASRAKRSK